MKWESITELIPYMISASKEAVYETFNLPPEMQPHFEGLVRAAFSDEAKNVLPEQALRRMLDHTKVSKAHEDQFFHEVRLAVVFFTYAIIRHEKLPTQSRTNFQRKGVDRKFTRIKELAAELEYQLCDLSMEQTLILGEALNLRGTDGDTFQFDLLKLARGAMMLRAATTLCTTQFKSFGRLTKGLRIEVLQNPEIDDEDGFAIDSPVSFIMFKRKGIKTNTAQLLIVGDKDTNDPKASRSIIGWIKGRTPLSGKDGFSVHPLEVHVSLLRLISKYLKDVDSTMRVPETINSTLPQLRLIQHFDYLISNLQDKRFQFTEIARRKKPVQPDPQGAVKELLKLIYNFKTTRNTPTDPRDSLLDKLVKETVLTQHESDGLHIDDEGFWTPNVFFAIMLTQHLGWRAD